MKHYFIETVTKTPDYTILRLTPDGHSGMDFEPGQYVTLSAVGKGIRTPDRCFSITSSPLDAALEVSFRPVGESTASLSGLTKGTSVMVQGPFGDFVLPMGSQPVVLLASGIGITPFISMLRAAEQSSGQRRMALVATTPRLSALPHIDELITIAKHSPNISVDIFSGAGEAGTHAGMPTQQHFAKLRAVMPHNAQYYICGGSAFTDQTINWLVQSGVDRDVVHTEAFTQLTKSASGKKSVQRVVWGSVSGAFAVVAVITVLAMLSAGASSQNNNSVNSTTTTTASETDTNVATPNSTQATTSTDSTSASTDTATDTTTSSGSSSATSSETSTTATDTQSYTQPTTNSMQPMSTAS